VKSLK